MQQVPLLLGILGCVVSLSLADDAASDATSTEGESAVATALGRDDLLSLWNGYRTQIASVKLEYQFQMLTFAEHPMSSGDALERLAKVDYSKTETLLNDLVAAFRPDMLTFKPDPLTHKHFALWKERTLSQRGQDFAATDPFHDHLAIDDIHLLFDNQMEQVKLYSRGGCMVDCPLIDRFRLIPDDAHLTSTMRIFPQGDVLRLQEDESVADYAGWIDVDPQTGLPVWQEVSDKETGEIEYLQIWREFATFPGDVVMPTVNTILRFHDGKLKRLDTFRIKEAQFNLEIPDEVFVRTARARSGWFDLREDSKTGGTFKEDIPDVVRFFKTRNENFEQLAAAPPLNEGSTSWYPILLLLNGLFFTAVGILLWRRSP